MSELENLTLNKAYQKLYYEYESLIKDMRVYWEENYGVPQYHDNFSKEFEKRKSSINSLITVNLTNLSKNLTSTTSEVNSFGDDIQKLNKNLNFHYFHYHISKIPV